MVHSQIDGPVSSVTSSFHPVTDSDTEEELRLTIQLLSIRRDLYGLVDIFSVQDLGII